MYAGLAYTKRFLGTAPLTEAQARQQMEQQFLASPELRTNQAAARLDEAKANNAMLMQHAKELEIDAEAARGEGPRALECAGRGRGLDPGTLATAGGFVIPGGLTRQTLGHKFRQEQEMFDQLTAGHPDAWSGPSRRARWAADSPTYLAWVSSGQMEQDYAQATSTQALAGQVGGGPAGTGRRRTGRQ